MSIGDEEASFELNDAGAPGPVILSVPHAGRAYPPGIETLLRPSLDRLLPLEDRWVDALVPGLGVPTLIATRPRLWIDLNRSEAELDPEMIEPRGHVGTIPSPKVRGGLGLIPRRLAGIGEIWRRRLSAAAVVRRIATDHRPYHGMLEQMVARAREHNGVAVLVDLHSMPPIVGDDMANRPQIVIGDRFGRSAAPGFTARALAAAAANGLAIAANRPYAGGYIVERHGQPGDGVHAIQIEVDRTLYLNPALDSPDPAGVARMRSVLDAIIDALADEATGAPALAAE